jgi:radical SAM superfamily enzyme YgiQ (UPF0313 family)
MKKPDLHRISSNGRKPPQDGPAPGLTVCLITALTVSDFIDLELSANAYPNTGAQLGVLTLAAILREVGIEPQIVNLDDLFFTFLKRSELRTQKDAEGAVSLMDSGRLDPSELQRAEFFYPFVIEHLRLLPFDVLGLSSICSSYPLTLRLAQEVRRLRPDATIILGGPQASVVDVATMRAFPCVDFIVRGEADETFPALLRQLSDSNGTGNWESIPGITFRRGDAVIRNHNAPVMRDLDRLPLPAFDLDAQIKGRNGVHLEIGRGCPFACTFCSTNDFFRRNFRLKSPNKMIEEMKAINKEYGATYFSFVHDMYTIDRKKVIAFCEALNESGEGFTWGCSARTDCVDDDLIGQMAQAGCKGIFFGIETGSQRLQAVINKNLDLGEALERIQCADQHQVAMAVALIVGFPEETEDDLRDTIHFFIDSLRFDYAEPQASLLAPLAATPIYEQHKDHLTFDHIFSDMSYQSWRQDPAEVEMIKSHPEIFPNFYAIPTTLLDRRYLKELMDFVRYLATWFRWLPVALLQDSGDFLKVFDRWQRWLAERSDTAADEDIGATPYYSHRRFRKEFVEFVRQCYLKEFASAPLAIAALCRVEGILRVCTSTLQSVKDVDYLNADCVPYQPKNLFAMDLEIDYQALIRSLRNKSDLSLIPERHVTIVFNRRAEKNIQVWQLAPVSGMLLRLCDGVRTVSEIVREFSLLEIGIDGVPPDKACLFGLMQLRKDGLVGISSGPLVSQEDLESNECEEASQYSPTSHTTNNQQPWPPGTLTENLPPLG